MRGNTTMHIRERAIGDGEPCYITFEAGPTHSGLESALALVDLAASANGDAIKFQIFDADRLVADKALPFSYDILVDRSTGETRNITEPLYDILARRQLTREEWRKVKRAVDRAGLAFFATVGFEDDIEFLAEVGCDSIKIASADVNHLPLIRQVARTGMVVQIDTGSSTLGEIETAVDTILSEGNSKIVIHQCPSGYPARLESINLRMIQTLRTMFPFPVAFSDHTPGWEMDIAARALGASMVEKTITLDRTIPSVEHMFSLEGEQLGQFVRSIRELETALGNPRRVLSPTEMKRRDSIRRSAFLRHAKRAGDMIADGDIEFRRPGTGIQPSALNSLVGKRVSKDVMAGTMLRWQDIIE